MKRVEYALYKGDELLAMGKVDEIAKEMGVREKTIRYYQTPQYKRRGLGDKSRKRRVLIKIEEDN